MHRRTRPHHHRAAARRDSSHNAPGFAILGDDRGHRVDNLANNLNVRNHHDDVHLARSHHNDRRSGNHDLYAPYR